MSDSSDHPQYSAIDPEPWKAVFVDVANGTPDEPTKAGLLALVRHGKDVWNAWRNAYPCRVRRNMNGIITTVGPKVDLRGHVFQDNVNFAEFLFGDDADFEGVRFRKTLFSNNEFYDKLAGPIYRNEWVVVRSKDSEFVLPDTCNIF